MNNIVIIGNILNLNLKKYEVVNYENNKENNVMIFGVRCKAKSCICPKCGMRTSKRQDLKEYE